MPVIAALSIPVIALYSFDRFDPSPVHTSLPYENTGFRSSRHMKHKKSKQRFPKTMAEQANRYRLYELSVQCPEAEIEFADTTYASIRGHRATVLREDFCGTARVCCQWVRLRRKNRAIGVDIDRKVLTWGQRHNVDRLSPAMANRVELIRGSVLEVQTKPPDILLATNFSYWVFSQRSLLKDYFLRVRHTLAEKGILFLDAYGGYDAFREIVEERELDGFTYIWEQAKYEPVSGNLICHIHFAFPDESRIDRAFSYRWRLWTLPEIRELLDEAGFSRVTVYWQGFDEDDKPDGIFVPADEGEADAGWICYLTAEK